MIRVFCYAKAMIQDGPPELLGGQWLTVSKGLQLGVLGIQGKNHGPFLGAVTEYLRPGNV